jgi:hypothetical protein
MSALVHVVDGLALRRQLSLFTDDREVPGTYL